MNDRHAYVPGSTWFFTLVTRNRRPALADDSVRGRFKKAVSVVQRMYPFEVRAFVLLPDHLHMLWSLPQGDPDPSGRWRLIRHQADNLCDPVWQPHFESHAVRSPREYVCRFDYIHGNPIRHGLVKQPGEWPHSSFHRCVVDGVYSPDWCDVDFEMDLE